MAVNTIACTPGQLPGVLMNLYKLKMAAFLWGEPGVGKSMCVHQFAKKINAKLEDIRLTQLDSPDLQGLKWIDEKTGTTRSYRPEFFPVENTPGVLFLDELTAAEPRMQATAYQLVLDRRVGPHVLPDNWMVIAAGNAPEDGAICYKMGTALSDRFVHIMVLANPQDWLEWALENNVHPNVVTFIKIKPDYLTSVAGQAKSMNMISPSPRSWARVSEVEYNISKEDISRSILINGIVGDAAAVEYVHTTEEVAELPSMEQLLSFNNPKLALKGVPIKKIACLYGLVYSMAAYVKTSDQIDRAMWIFDALRDTETDQPVAEIETLANEMLLAKANKLGILPEVVSGKAYKNYSPRAKQVVER